jgi:excisionase family DNA binding protein
MGLETGIRTILREVVRDEVRAAMREQHEAGLAVRSEATPAQDGYISVLAAAQILGVDHKTIRRWIVDGALPVLRRGRVLRIRRTDLEKIPARRGPRNSGHEVDQEVRRLLAKR